MRVLHVLDHSIPLHSGYSFRTRAILEQQRALGWFTRHLTSPKHYGTDAIEEEVDGLHFYRCMPLPAWQARVPALNQLVVVHRLERRLMQVIAKVQPDLIHAHSPALNGLAALRAARRWRLPVVYEVRALWEDAAVDHGTTRPGSVRYRLTSALETHVLRRVDAVTCICEGLRGDITARGISAERITVIPNAVDPARFRFDLPRDEALATELGLDGEATVLGFIGSFYGYEGLELAVRALGAIRRRHPRLRLLLVGGGPQEERLRALARELGLADAVLFAGRVAHDQVARYYSLVDVFLYPRLPIRLTELVTPLKPLEAMAQGRLVVASDVGGHRELIRDGENGFLFPAGSVDGVVEGIAHCLAAAARWPELRAAARHFVETERNWTVSVGRYADVYRPLLRRPAGLMGHV
ncbi:MAG: glycosyltransferase, exosortase A system-associated [Nitrococcus mobilis]|nr:glycosyltransferase, exosortase A system-associated [Nitrococcus mobilis]